jgi:hypothetical protein
MKRILLIALLAAFASAATMPTLGHTVAFAQDGNSQGVATQDTQDDDNFQLNENGQ